MKKYLTREVKIGFITLLSLVVLYFGINYLKGINLLKPTNHYYVKFKNVMELQKSSPVYIDGFKIGIVNDILYEYDNPGNIIVLISLEKSMKIQKGSYVEMTTGLTSGASLHLVLNQYVTDYCAIGDTIEGSPKLGMMEVISDNLLPQLEGMLPKIDSILYGLQAIVNHPALSQSLDHIEKTTSNLERTTAKLNLMMDKDIPVIMQDFKHISSDFAVVSSELKGLDFNKTFNSLNATLDNVHNLSNQLNSKDNNIGLLLNDRQLYDNLNATTENASLLLLDLKQNPKRYVHFSIF